jgi:hypothetical protein
MTSALKLSEIPDIPSSEEYDHVGFCHPYNGCRFLALPKVDIVHNTNSDTETRMLHTKTALSACYIIANNTPGFFSVYRDRAQAIAAKLEAEFLDGDVDKVFYHLTDETIPVRYPICAKFRNWDFPRHDSEALKDWKATASQPTASTVKVSQSGVSEAVKIRDTKCRTTKFTAFLETSHLIPAAESTWVCSYT